MESRQNLTTRLRFLEQEILVLQNQLANAPQGTLICRRQSNGTYKYYRRIIGPDNTYKEFYLKKQFRDEARQLAEKMVAEKKLLDYQNEKKVLQKTLAFQKNEPATDVFLRQHSGIASLLMEKDQQSEKPWQKWKYAPYSRNQNYLEHLKYTTVVPGLLVRSKSEAMIVDALERHGVPYHYDEYICLNGEFIAVDFVCLNVKTGEFYYWDHRGMMNDPDYIKKTLYCENLFYSNGFIPWINMIVTTETQDRPLDLQWVETIIEHYLV